MAKTKAVTGDTDDLLKEARDAYERCREWWNDNQKEAQDDLQFARLGKQWPEKVRRQRELELRPCEDFNKMPAFIRQVVNDARQNKPAIKVHPQDSKSDPRTAEIINGLIRNIEVTSDADVAYDTAIEHAVGQGFGFWRINTAYTCDDAFDQDIVIERVANPFTVYGDPRSQAADSSDWNVAFIVTTMTKDEFEAQYPEAENVDWEHDYRDCADWLDGDDVVVAEYWTREKVKGEIVALSDGSVVKVGELEERAEELTLMGIEVVGEPREIETYKVTQRIMSGAEILKTVEWAGKYIPIIPVYGDEVIDEDGKRHFRSLIRDAKGSQRMYNYMRNTGIEILALQPRAPFVGEERAFELDPNWSTANSQSHPYLMVPQGAPIPERQPPPQGSQAVLQEALNANDDMKSIIGIYDASLGAKSNETSGKAIMARQREGDVSTFHFIDNLSRAIRHGGRVLLDLIPKVYSTERMIRVLGEDMQPKPAKIGPTGEAVQDQGMQPGMEQSGQAEQLEQGQPDLAGVNAVYDLTVGKYDLTVSSGPSYTSRREEVMQIMTEWARAGGEEVATVLAPRIAKLLDIPDADKIAEELEAKLNPQQQGMPPEVQEQMQQGMELIQQLQQENAQLKGQVQNRQADTQIKSQEMQLEAVKAQQEAEDRQAARQLEAQKLQIEQFRAQTERMKVIHEVNQPPEAPPSERAAA